MVRDLETFRADIAERPAFAVAEYERRVEAARQAMVASEIDAVILFDPQSVCYFTGYTSVNLWDLCAVVLPLAGPMRVVLWDFEVPRFEASGALGELVAYAAHTDPIDGVVRALANLQVRGYGSDQWTPHITADTWRRVQDALAPATPRDVRRVLWATRLRKSPAEIQMLQDAARATDAGVAAAVEAALPGATDRGVTAAAAAAMLRAGSGHFSIQPIIAVGPRAGVAHSEASGRAIRSGEGMFLELGASIHRYTAPVMRTVAVGEPDDDLVALASLASRTVEATVKAMRPGVTCAEVAKTAHDVIAEGDPDILFHGYVGYPVGVSFPPSWLEDLAFYIHKGNGGVLEEGMAFHVPISLRRRGVRGVGLSYSVVVGPQGAEILTGTPATLILR